MADSAKTKLATGILASLKKGHSVRQIPSSDGDMTETLLMAVIAKGTTIPAARMALDKIKESVVNWNELRVTPPAEVAAYMKGLKDAGEKAAAMHEVLVNIFEGTHGLKLSFLEGVSAQEARDFLSGLGSLTDEMVAEVILSGRGHFHMSAEADVIRVARRMGLVSRTPSAAKCQEELEGLLGEEKAYQIMYLMKELGESSCISHSPKCGDCVVNALCDAGKKPSRK